MKIYKAIRQESGQIFWFTDKKQAEQHIYLDDGDSVEICEIDTPITRKNLINFLDNYCRFAT